MQEFKGYMIHPFYMILALYVSDMAHALLLDIMAHAPDFTNFFCSSCISDVRLP